MKNLALLFLGLTFISPVQGQIFLNGYDSIPVSKPKSKKTEYFFNHSQVSEIRARLNYYDYSARNDKQFFKDAFLGTLALFARGNFSFGSEMDVIWNLQGKLICNDERFNWDLSLMCSGKVEKQREGVDNGDGTQSLETTRTGTLYWDLGAVSFIIEGHDTIGRFTVLMHPREDPALVAWSDTVFTRKPLYVRTKSENEWYRKALNGPDIDYGIIGTFRGEDILMIINGFARISWFVINGELVCVFRPDNDFGYIKEPDRRMPYLLLEKSVPYSEQPDWFRLAIFSRLVSTKLIMKNYSF